VVDDDAFELWGTFSVRDHVQPWAFIAEVLIYDRLVVPVPPEDEPEEWGRWDEERWDPARQRELLEVLGDRAVAVEWNAERRGQWDQQFLVERERLADQVAFEAAIPYRATGAVLIQDVPRMARPVVATTLFTSIPEIERALSITRLPPGTALPGGTISAVLGTEFLIPADPRRGELELLAEAVEVARGVDYRAARAALYRFQRMFTREDLTDLASVKEAVHEMGRLAGQLRAATEREHHWGGIRRVLEFANVAMPLGVGLVSQDPVATVGAAIGVGAFTTSHRLRDPTQPQGTTPEAALVVDAGRRLADF
jgi:hypothetical protein